MVFLERYPGTIIIRQHRDMIQALCCIVLLSSRRVSHRYPRVLNFVRAVKVPLISAWCTTHIRLKHGQKLLLHGH